MPLPVFARRILLLGDEVQDRHEQEGDRLLEVQEIHCHAISCLSFGGANIAGAPPEGEAPSP